MTTKSTTGTLLQKVLETFSYELVSKKLYTCMLTHKADTVTALALLNKIVQALRYVTYFFSRGTRMSRKVCERLHSKCLSSRLVTT